MNSKRRWFPRELHWQIGIALIIGVIVGLSLHGHAETPFINKMLVGFEFGGELFIRLLKMVVVPLVASSLFIGITGVQSSAELGSIGIRTAIYYVFSSLVAITVGLGVVNLIKPGVGSNLAESLNYEDAFKVAKPESFLNSFLNIVPENPIGAMASVPFDMLGLIFFVVIFGIFAMKVDAETRRPIVAFVHGVAEIMTKMVGAIILLAPIGVFFLVAKLVSSAGAEVFIPLLWYLVTVTIALLVHVFIVLPIAIYFFTKQNPYAYLSQMSPALLTAFSTASSAATLSLTMKCSQLNKKVSESVSSLVLPLGATINMDGTALYEGVAVIFIAQVLGHDVTLFQQFIILMTALLVSIGAAGIPHAGLVMMVIILEAVGLPVEATALIWAVDRVVDMGRTAVNVWSDASGALIIEDSVNKAMAKRIDV